MRRSNLQGGRRHEIKVSGVGVRQDRAAHASLGLRRPRRRVGVRDQRHRRRRLTLTRNFGGPATALQAQRLSYNVIGTKRRGTCADAHFPPEQSHHRMKRPSLPLHEACLGHALSSYSGWSICRNALTCHPDCLRQIGGSGSDNGPRDSQERSRRTTAANGAGGGRRRKQWEPTVRF